MDAVQNSIYRYWNARHVGFHPYSRSHGYHENTVKDYSWNWLYANNRKRLHLDGKLIDSSGIFSLKYSPSGNLLIAACENKSFITMDPNSEKVIYMNKNAHTDCCNLVTFLDDRMFATCSDDCTIAVWDLRNLQHKVHQLNGHTSWVKNIEYHASAQKLLSSGFDSNVNMWDLNKTDSNGCIKPERLLTVQGLCRMKLSGDGKSMYISSVDIPYIIAVHNVNLFTMSEDIGRIKKDCESQYSTTKRKLTPEDRLLPVNKQNYVELYYTEVDDADSVIPSHSIDVHPRNCALLLNQLGEDILRTVVQNTKRFCHHAFECPCDAEPNLKCFPRGQETHILEFDHYQGREYIEEASFSTCGKFFAFPIGFGAILATYNSHFHDYETCMAMQLESLSSKHARDTEKGHLIPKVSKSHIIKSSFGHNSPVLCTQFSPKYIQLATGCEGGKIIFHNPVL